MFFADDTYLFYKANQETATQVKDMLHISELASGQKINVDKSSVFFSNNVEREEKLHICQELLINEAGDNTSYLGLPNMIGRNKNAVFGYLKNRLRDMVETWDKKYLSGGGKRYC